MYTQAKLIKYLKVTNAKRPQIACRPIPKTFLSKFTHCKNVLHQETSIKTCKERNNILILLNLALCFVKLRSAK